MHLHKEFEEKKTSIPRSISSLFHCSCFISFILGASIEVSTHSPWFLGTFVCLICIKVRCSICLFFLGDCLCGYKCWVGFCIVTSGRFMVCVVAKCLEQWQLELVVWLQVILKDNDEDDVFTHILLL